MDVLFSFMPTSSPTSGMKTFSGKSRRYRKAFRTRLSSQPSEKAHKKTPCDASQGVEVIRRPRSDLNRLRQHARQDHSHACPFPMTEDFSPAHVSRILKTICPSLIARGGERHKRPLALPDSGGTAHDRPQEFSLLFPGGSSNNAPASHS